MNLEDKTPWEAWILLSNNKLTECSLDKLAELAVSSYQLKAKRRDEDCMDNKHFFILWWNKNKNRFYNYRTITSLSILLGMNHSTVIHHLRHRKKSFRFEENTKCLRDFLTS